MMTQLFAWTRPEVTRRLRCSTWIPAIAVVIIVLPAAAGAQIPKQPHDSSFSNASSPSKIKNAGSQLLADVASEQSTADAIAADALHDIYLQADEHWHKGEWNHTINLNQIVMEGDPHNMDVYADSAWLLWSSDRDAQAVTTLKKGIAANPNNYYMYDELGAHYWLHHKDAKDALPYYEQAVKFKCPWATWHGLAHCYEMTGQWDKALEAWQKASNYPGDRAALVNLRRVKAHIAQLQSGKH